MAAAMSDADSTASPAEAGVAQGGRVEYGTIVVVGGGCYGSYYVRQLGRARAAGALTWERLLVVDRDGDCRVATERRRGMPTAVGPELVLQDWRDFFADYLDEATSRPLAAATDAVVPSPLMPHLMFEWLVERARARWPDRGVDAVPLDRPPQVPWQRAGTDGTHYVSFAEWMCPINCIEPRLCPHTRGPRTWSMPPALRAFVAAERARGVALAGPVLFHCTHRAYGVGMIDTRDVVAGDDLVAHAGTAGSVSVLVGTVSHCHGALGVLRIGGSAARPTSGSDGGPDSRN
jgi:hypothetical protein